MFWVLEVKKSKILQKLNNRECFVYILGFIFNGVSRPKTDLHNKHMIYVFGSFFELDHLLNLFILGAYAKRLPK